LYVWDLEADADVAQTFGGQVEKGAEPMATEATAQTELPLPADSGDKKKVKKHKKKHKAGVVDTKDKPK
jgi:hypothetical protein